jgi:hypothetical protein
MEAKQLELFGNVIELAPDKVSTNAIYIEFTQLELEQAYRIAEGFVDLFSNLDGLYERADLIANEIRDLAIEQAMKALAKHGLYEISEQLFFDRFMDQYDSWDRDFEPIASAYEAMVERTAELDAYRTARRQNRAKWVGLNERGVHEADAKNVLSNVGHGMFNLMAKGVTAIGNALKKDEIFKNPQTLARVRDGMGNIVAAAREGAIEALSTLKPGSVYLYKQDEVARATAIVEHVHKGRVPDLDLLPALLKAIQTYPYNRDVYALLLQHCGGDAGHLDDAVAYFGLTALDQEKQQLFEARRRGVDLSTLEALDAQLPALISYAQTIGYTLFTQEAIKLREVAARRSFDNRVHALREASAAQVQAQFEALRAYAAEIGVEGADEILTQLLTAARLRDFMEEAAKHPLASPEDCDRNLPLLKVHARLIGYDDFDAWAEMTRKRAVTPHRKKSQEDEDTSVGGNNAKAGAKNRAPAKPTKIGLIFAMITVIVIGGYKAYAHFTTPAEPPPIATVSPEETVAPTPTQIPAPLEPASASLPQLATSDMQSSPLQPLSPAAEQAIREGFVEIEDPSVKTCTDSKVAGFRREMGEDAMLRYDIYNEFAVACGFNI